MGERRTVVLRGGALMPTVGLGTWKSEKAKVGDAVRTAISSGYRHVDCAAIYGNEAEVGEALDGAIRAGEVTRSDLFITTKLWNTEHGYSRVRPALEKSLQLLKYVDLYLMHWPIALKADNSFDTDIHFTEAWKGMEELVEAGLTRHIGLSNFNQKQTTEILGMAKVPPAVLQVECHPYLSQPDLVDFCLQNDIQVTAYCPLARAGFPRPDRPGNLLEHPAVVGLAKAHSATPAQILLRFQMERGITAIPKSVTTERIIENNKVYHFSLAPDEMATLNSINIGWRVLTNERDQDHPLFPFPPTKAS